MLNIIHKEKAINNWNCSKFGKSKVNHDALVQVDVVMENSIEHIEWCQQNSDQEEWSIPSKWKYGKRKQLKNIIGVLGNSQTNIYCNKVNKQLGKIQKTGRILLCVCVCVCVCFTLISPLTWTEPPWSVKGGGLTPCYLPQSRLIAEILMCYILPYLGLAWKLVFISLSSEFELKSSLSD